MWEVLHSYELLVFDNSFDSQYKQGGEKKLLNIKIVSKLHVSKSQIKNTELEWATLHHDYAMRWNITAPH